MLETAVRSKWFLIPEDFIGAAECSEFRTYKIGMEKLLELQACDVGDFAGLVGHKSRLHCGGFIEVVAGSRSSQNYCRKCMFLPGKLSTIEDHHFNQEGDDAAESAKYARAAEQTIGRSIKRFLDSLPSEVLREHCSPLGEPLVITPLGYAAFSGLRSYIIESIASDQSLLRNAQDLLLS